MTQGAEIVLSTEPSPSLELELMASIFDAKNQEDFASRVSRVVKSCGFESYMIALQLKGVDGRTILNVTTSYPDKWMQIYSERQYALMDPAVHHCQTNTNPIVWRDDVFATAGAQALLEEAQSFGVSHGVSVAVHERTGRKSMLSLVRDRSFQNDPRELARMVALCQVLSSCMHVVATRLIAPDVENQSHSKLSGQETECLQWVAKGKTSWEIGQIMHIAEPTVVFHLKNVMKKLGAVNRHQALAVAMRLGIVD